MRYFRLLLWTFFVSVITVLVVGSQSVSSGPQKSTASLSAARVRLQAGPDDSVATQPRMSTLEIEQIILTDRQGRKLMRLAGEDSGPSIVLFDSKGKKRLELRVRDEVPAIAIMNEEEQELTTVQVVGNEASLLMGSRSEDKKCSVSLHSGPQPRPGLYLRDSEGTPVANLTNERPGEAELRLESTKGGTSVKADGIFVQDTKEHNRACLAFTNGNRPVISLSASNQEGSPSMEMTVGDDGSRQFSIQNHSGFQLFSLGASKKSNLWMSMQHPDAEGTLQVSLGPKDEGGPRISCFAPVTPGHRGTVLPKLQLGLNKDCEPYLRLNNSEGKAMFSAP